MLSTSSKYALKAVLYLAVNASETHKILAADISGPTNIPKPYLSKILQDLSRHGIVSSIRGPKGGFYLNDANKAVKLMAIIQIMDGDYRLSSCMLSLKDCNALHPCPLHDLVGNAKTNFVKNLESTTVEDLVADIKNGKSFLPL